MGQYLHKMSRDIVAHVWQQADIMQNVTDAGLVPGKKQTTMGLEINLRERELKSVKYVVSDRTPQIMNIFYNPEVKLGTMKKRKYSSLINNISLWRNEQLVGLMRTGWLKWTSFEDNGVTLWWINY